LQGEKAETNFPQAEYRDRWAHLRSISLQDLVLQLKKGPRGPPEAKHVKVPRLASRLANLCTMEMILGNPIQGGGVKICFVGAVCSEACFASGLHEGLFGKKYAPPPFSYLERGFRGRAPTQFLRKAGSSYRCSRVASGRGGLGDRGGPRWIRVRSCTPKCKYKRASYVFLTKKWPTQM
jgi:hypothetical protein